VQRILGGPATAASMGNDSRNIDHGYSGITDAPRGRS
jgi:hypothetical protein